MPSNTSSRQDSDINYACNFASDITDLASKATTHIDNLTGIIDELDKLVDEQRDKIKALEEQLESAIRSCLNE